MGHNDDLFTFTVVALFLRVVLCDTLLAVCLPCGDVYHP